MTKSRLLYFLLLLTSVLCQIFFDTYPAHLLFLISVSLPPLSLLLSLPAVLRLRPQLQPSVPSPARGAEAKWLLCWSHPSRFPLARLSLSLRLRNRLTGEEQHTAFEQTGLSCTASLTFPMDTRHCGHLECRAEHLRVLDYLGLFSLPIRSPGAASALVLPLPTAPLPLPEPNGVAILSSSPLTTPDEGEYDPRPYRPGDPLHAVHWKLSAKRDDLIVREPLSRPRPIPLLFCDCPSSPDALDRTLDLLQATSAALLRRGRPHLIRWGEATFSVSCREELHRALAAVLAAPPSSPAPPENTYCIRIAATPEEPL